MKTKIHNLSWLGLLLVCSLAPRGSSLAAPLGTAFSYQGRLSDGGQTATGSYDLRFRIYDAVADGSLVSGVLTNPATPVVNGFFEVTLDFGAGVFTGEARWLEIGVRTNGSPADFTTLAPRQPLTPSPYALHAPTAGSAAAVTGPVAASQLTGTIAPSNIAAGSILATHLAAGSVTTAALADGAVTAAKMATASNWVAWGQAIPNPTPGVHDYFGKPLAAVGNDSVLIAAWNDDTAAQNAGAAYLFSSEGVLQVTFLHPDPATNDYFGSALAAVGTDRVLIGAPNHNTRGAAVAGVAYLFSTKGNLVNTFTNPSPTASAFFGSAVAGIGETRVAIAAPYDDAGAENAGVVYLYTTNAFSRSWSLVTLTNPAPEANALFGFALTGVGTGRVLIGAPYHDTGAANAGVAYLFGTDGSLLTRFTNPAPGLNDHFGMVVAALGADRVLIGAPDDDANGTDSGSVYLFKTDGTLLKTFAGTEPGALFGTAVAATEGGRVVIGATLQDTSVTDAGAAFLFDTNGVLITTFTNPTPASMDRFGDGVAAVGSDRVFVGARWSDMQEIDAGAAYLFKTQTYMPGVVTDEVRAGSVTTASLANGAVGSNQLAAGAVGSGQLAPGAVGNAQLAAGAAFSNLYDSGQSGVALGGVVMSEDPDNVHLLNAGYVRLGSSTSLNLTPEAWRALVSNPAGNAQPIAGRTGHSSIWTGSEMIIWGGYNDSGGFMNTGARYDPALDGWTVVSQSNAPSPRSGHTAVWTGTQMIIWGGAPGSGEDGLNTGKRYSPASDTWLSMSTVNAPFGRYGHAAVWSGNVMVVWGGATTNTYNWTEQHYGADYLHRSNLSQDGGRYDPGADLWTPVRTDTSATRRIYPSAVWTGSEMIVWGGYYGASYSLSGTNWSSEISWLNDGGRYNPVSDTWNTVATNGAPVGRQDHSVVWTGSRMIIWGGRTSDTSAAGENTGGRYDPAANTWSSLSTVSAPTARFGHTAVWTGARMVVWGGIRDFNYAEDTGGRYDPSANAWSSVSMNGAPTARRNPSSVWTGSRMLVWGGMDANGVFPGTGGRYEPVNNTWTNLSALPAPSEPWARRNATAVWTGSEMIVWGGENNGQYLRSGAKFDPAANSWSALPTTNAPAARIDHTAVWTGTEMLVWGGYNGQTLGDGARYMPAQDTWSAIPANNAPSARRAHTAVWTGNEMIVWGGYARWYGLNNFLATGGRYVPATGQWTPVSTNGAPTERAAHTAVWTGDEMILWGGFAQVGFPQPDNVYLGSGARYRPALDSGGQSAPWTDLAANNAPSPRRGHTAVWTGKEMVLWGGDNGSALGTGGRYLPESDSWSSTSATSAPSARQGHTAVWTGAHMLIWGGRQGATEYNTGGRYSPTLDKWLPITTGSAPGARYDHVAVWTGSEMLIWGGYDGANCLDTIKGYTPPLTLYLYLKP
ncbi:MAG TPA: hypothetical protein VJA21_01055 [Verrucomicrobiae bacterium]